MKHTIILLLAIIGLSFSAKAQDKYDVQRKDTSVVVVKTSPQGEVEEIPVTSKQLESDYKAAQTGIELLTMKRDRLAQLIEMDKQLDAAKEFQELRGQLISKVKKTEEEIRRLPNKKE